MTNPNFNQQAIRDLELVCGDNLRLEQAERYTYGYDNSRRHVIPDAVIFAESTNQVQQVVRICNQHKIPLVARGRGTGTTGGTVPLRHGVVISFERMNSILEMDPANRFMVVQPGVTNTEVQNAAAEHGFFWPPDPTSADYCSVGGNLAFNSAGPRAVKYGTARENTLGLRAITGTGAEIRTGVMTTKGVVGYDLTRLLIGSEGTLAIITEATLKLTPLAQAKRTLQLTYRDINAAARAVSAVMAQSVVPCALEFMDAAALDLVRQHSSVALHADARAMLIIEVDGLEAHLEDATARVIEAANNDDCLSHQAAVEQQDIDELWKARKALSPALRHIAPKKINEDVVVPVSNIPALIHGLEQLSQQYTIPIVNFGHAGNGNIHVNLLIDPDNSKQMNQAHDCLNDVFKLVLELRGTLSGEHGVGIEKRDFINMEIDPNSLALMRAIKQQFDPNNILNPDKILPLT